MYANLKVTAPVRAQGEKADVFYAWRVEIDVTGVTVYIDASDGQSSYAEPNGELRLALGRLPIKIEADF